MQREDRPAWQHEHFLSIPTAVHALPMFRLVEIHRPFSDQQSSAFGTDSLHTPPPHDARRRLLPTGTASDLKAIKKPKASSDTLGSGLHDLWPRYLTAHQVLRALPTPTYLIRVLNIIIYVVLSILARRFLSPSHATRTTTPR